MNICIVGGGNLTHALVAIIGSNPEFKVSVLSNSFKNTKSIKGILPNGKKLIGNVDYISNDPALLIPKSDVVLITVPAFARKTTLIKLKKYIDRNCIIGALPGIAGFDEEMDKVFDGTPPKFFSAQRVPCIARIIKNNKSVDISLKEEMYIATNDRTIKPTIEKLFNININLLNDFLEVNLSNSNPLLHSARIYQILKTNPNILIDGLNAPLPFYESWDNYSSKTLIQMDNEFMSLVNKLELKNIKSLYEHYGVENASEMTMKLSNIAAFKGIKLPMINVNNKYYLDLNSRYFTEDVDIGLNYILEKLRSNNLDCSSIESVYNKLVSIRA